MYYIALHLHDASFVEQRPMLLTVGYGQHGSQRVNTTTKMSLDPLTSTKLGLFLFLQLNDGIVISGVPSSCTR